MIDKTSINTSVSLPLVSIILVCRNSVKTIERSLKSVLELDYPNFEYVVQDGVSTDGTLEILNKYAPQFGQRMKLVSEPDMGVEDGFHRALDRCEGSIIGSCLSDDELLPNAVTFAVNRFQEHPDAGVIHGDIYNTDLKGNILSKNPAKEFNLAEYLSHHGAMHLAASFFRIAALQKAGLFNHDWFDDFYLWCRLSLHAKIIHVPVILAKYAISSNQLSERPELMADMIANRSSFIEKFLQNAEVPQEVRNQRIDIMIKFNTWAIKTLTMKNRLDEAKKYQDELQRLKKSPIDSKNVKPLTQSKHLPNEQPVLTILCQGRNDSYMGNFAWRLSTVLNKHAENIILLGLENQVELLVSDWGSSSPLHTVLELTENARRLVKYLITPAEIASLYDKDAGFSVPHAINAIARRAKGNYVMFSDSDVYIPTETMTTLMHYLHLGYIHSFNIRDSFFWASKYLIPNDFTVNSPCREHIEEHIQRNWTSYVHESVKTEEFTGSGACLLMSRQMWLEATGWDERLIYKGWNDIDFTRRLLFKYRWDDLEKHGMIFFHLEHYRNRSKPDCRLNPCTEPTTISPNPPNWGLADHELIFADGYGLPIDTSLGHSLSEKYSSFDRQGPLLTVQDIVTNNPLYRHVDRRFDFDPSGWFTNTNEVNALLETLQPQTVCEIGSWMGASARCFAAYPSVNLVACVDHWDRNHLQNYKPGDHPEHLLNNMYEQFLANAVHSGTDGKIRPIRLNSDSAVEYCVGIDMRFDLIYIDGDHTTVGARADILKWHPLLNDGGYMCGDDWTWQKEPDNVAGAVVAAAREKEWQVFYHGNFWLVIPGEFSVQPLTLEVFQRIKPIRRAKSPKQSSELNKIIPHEITNDEQTLTIKNLPDETNKYQDELQRFEKLPVDSRNDKISKALLVSLPGLNTGYEPIFPLGIGYLLAAIRRDRPAQAVHYQVFEHATRQLPEIISAFQPQIVGLTCSTFNRGNVRKICAWLRQHHPHIKIILGGVHVSFLAEQALREYGADCVVIGEGELTFRELCNAMDKDIPLAGIRGIAFRAGEQIVTTEPREVVHNLDDLPLPDYSYAGDLMKKSGMGFIITSRGCPVRCHFCSTGSYWGQRVRVNSPKRVVDEMESLVQNYGVKKILFHDDTFNLGTKRVLEICDEISSRKLNVEWGVQSRVHPVSQEMIDRMVAAGCRHICWGIESGSVQMLARINKKITQEQISGAYELCRKHLGTISVGAFTMVGNPGESKETIAESSRFINTLPMTDPPSTAILYILPGTQLYKEIREKHPEIDRFWVENDGVPQYNLEHPPERLQQWANVISRSGNLVRFDRNHHFWNNVLFGNIPAPSVPSLSFLDKELSYDITPANKENENRQLKNSYADNRSNADPAKTPLPINFFTIVLNGEPFIRHHIEVFSQLPFKWHWHIVEGVADLKHDTGWSLKFGGKITDELHRNGLSNDGSTEYLNELAKQFPENIFIYRKPDGAFWDGKLEMVNAPLVNINEECLLWQVDVDEYWTLEQIRTANNMFANHPRKTAAYYLCNFFVGPELIITTRNTYGNHTDYEWLRTWRYKPGDRWAAHEPPRLCRSTKTGQMVDLAKINPFMHLDTEEKNLIFNHYAYVSPQQLRFKEIYYGYANAVKSWNSLQSVQKFPVLLKDYFPWVKDGALVDRQCSNTRTLGIVKKILWIRTDSIGDNILASSMLPYIEGKFKNAQITVLCQEHIAELYEACPYVASTIVFNRIKALQDEGYRNSILKDVQALKADLCLNSVYSREPLTDFFAAQSGATQRVAMEGNNCRISKTAKDYNNGFYTSLVQNSGCNKNEMDHHKTFLSGIGIPVSELSAQFWITTEDEEFADVFFAKNKLIPARTIALFCSSQEDRKNYDFFGFALKKICSDNGLSIIALGGPNDADFNQKNLDAISSNVINLSGKTTLRQSAALLSRCVVAVGVDTSLAHIACAVNTPNVILLGGGNFGRFMPYSPLTSIVCLPLECYDCNWKCRYDRVHCTKDITPEVTAEAVRQTLEKKSDKPRVFVQGTSLWEAGLQRPKWEWFNEHLDINTVEIIPVGVVPSMPKTANEQYKISQEHITSGNFDEAINELTKLLDVYPDFALAYNDLGVIYYNKGDKEKALEYYEKAVALNPENINFQKNLADFYFVELGRTEDAISIYLKVLAAHPEDIEALLAIGNFCITVEKINEAKVFFNRALALEPQNSIAIQSLNALLKVEIVSETLLSAVISVYNSEEFIRGCLQTLIEQSLYEKGKLEIIVIDSGSEQDEKSIIDEYQRKHPNIKYIRTKERETIYQAWNRGAMAASGKYIVNTNTDDRLRRDALEIMADVLERREDVGVVYIDQIITEYPNENFATHHENGFLKRSDFSKEIIVQRNPCGPQVMWRKHLHELVGYFNSTYEVAGDWDFWLRMVFETKFTAYHIPELLGLYYHNKKGLEHGGRKQVERQREIAEIKRKYSPQIQPERKPSTAGSHKTGSLSLKRVLLTTSAAPSQSPFSTTEKRPPIGVGFLIAVLRNAGHEVFFIDNYLKPSDFLETDYLQRNAIEYVGIYTNTICFRDTLRMLYRLDYMRRLGVWSGKIIVGGPHTTVALDTIPDFVDHVVQGEGERAILDIIEGRATERVIRFPSIKELDTLPMPAWDYFVNLPYNWGGDWLGEKPVFTMNTSRGCPFKCSFCSVGSIWGKQYTYFSAERIVSDIEYLIKQYGAKGIYFREDNFTLDRKRLLKFCNLLIEKEIKISWACESRVNTIDRELVALMHRAGARAFYFGVESGSQRLLDFLNKDITIEQTKKVFQLCHEYGIKAAASVIVGVPTETANDLSQTTALLEEIKPAVTWYNIFVGIPNSKLYQYAIEHKLYEFIDDRGLVYLKGHNERVRKYYGSQWDAYIPFNIESPVISVIMSVYNGEQYIRESIKSILSQTYQDFEFIIIDDASTDRTESIIKGFNDRRIRLITNHKNIGLTKSLNKGISKAKGEYIARMDADDISLPHRFKTQIEFLENNPDYAIVGSSFYQIDEKGEISRLIRVLCEDKEIKKGLWDQNWFGHGSVMVRKDALLKVGSYNERFKMAQDYDLWFRIAGQYKIANIDEPLYCWRLTATCISNEKRDEQRYYATMAVSEARERGQTENSNGEEHPLVSVIVPTYNRPDMLPGAIKSILDQTYSNFEIIVVNDAGVDVESIVFSLNNTGKITYKRQNRNMGLAAARNTGIKAAKGEYIALLDDDDVFYPDHLETAMSGLSKSQKVVYTDAVRATYHKKGDDYKLAGKHVPYSMDFNRNKLLLGNISPVNCFVFEKDLALKAGLFDETLSTLEDWDFWIRLSALAPFKHISKPTVQVNWRTDGTTMTSSRQSEFRKNREAIYNKNRAEISKISNTNEIMAEFQAIWSKDSMESAQYSPVKIETVKGLVSIVILTFNELKYTRECVESIKKHTPEPHEIIFIDNASADDTLKWLRKISKENPNYKLIENKNNLGFAKGCNQGIEASSGEYILLLNNDVVVTEDWLSGMLECLNSSPDTGIVGPMTNNISGPQKVQGADYKTIPRMIEYAKSFRQRYSHRRIYFRRIVGFCMLLRHALIDKIGLLDESFGTGNFEDDDYCLRATLAGCRNLIAGDVFIHHYGSRSFIGNRIDYGSSISGNIKIFDEKWTGIDVNTPLGKKVAAFNIIDKADTLYQKGHLDKAIAVFIEGIKYAPEEKAVYYRLAEMLLDAKLHKDALEAVESMPQEMSDDLKRLEIIAYCTEGIEEAGKLADRILNVDKDYAAAINLKGINAYKQGENTVAEDFFGKAIASDPGYGEPYTNLGIMKWAADQKEEALDCLEKGFILSPALTDNVTLYHSAITATEQFERAEELFHAAKKLHPENKRILFFLIDIFIKQSKYDAAMHEIEQAMLDIGIDNGMLAAAIEIREKVGIKEIEKAVNNKGTLSLCMIVKNEEQHLTRCLLSATPAVDEMIVVDTGSTDRTKDIARAFGARVFDFPWTNDFSEARNVSLSKASGDWIIVLDADEVISSQDYASIEKIVKKRPPKPVAYTLVTRNYTNEVNSKGWIANDRKYLREEAGTGWFPSAKVRLFVNDQRIRFQNPVHEFVEGSLEKAGIEIKASGIPVHHYGRFDKDKIIAKGKEYFLLGKKKIDQMKDDIKALKELAVQASELGEYVTAVKLWKRVIELNPNDSVAFLNIGYAYLKLEKYEDGLVSSRRAMELDPAMKEAALNYAGSEFIIGDIKITISILETLLRKDSYYPPAMALAAAVYYVDGQKDRSIELFEKLRKKGFDCTEFFDEQIRALMSQEKFEQAFSLLEAAIKTGSVNKDTRELLAQCHSKISTLPA